MRAEKWVGDLGHPTSFCLMVTMLVPHTEKMFLFTDLKGKKTPPTLAKNENFYCKKNHLFFCDFKESTLCDDPV